ncbi:hypothetical protein [Mycolicibacterium sp.]|uniref:hypothetical protein n=1 Tax=Mycolicibacterium sp. TaxID=2320850 RepID=UPI0037CC86E3
MRRAVVGVVLSASVLTTTAACSSPSSPEDSFCKTLSSYEDLFLDEVAAVEGGTLPAVLESAAGLTDVEEMWSRLQSTAPAGIQEDVEYVSEVWRRQSSVTSTREDFMLQLQGLAEHGSVARIAQYASDTCGPPDPAATRGDAASATGAEVTLTNVTVPSSIAGYTLVTESTVPLSFDFCTEVGYPRAGGEDSNLSGSAWSESLYYTNDPGALSTAADCDAVDTSSLMFVVVTAFPDEATSIEMYDVYFLSDQAEQIAGINCAVVAQLVCGGRAGLSYWSVFKPGAESDLPALADITQQIMF